MRSRPSAAAVYGASSSATSSSVSSSVDGGDGVVEVVRLRRPDDRRDRPRGGAATHASATWAGGTPRSSATAATASTISPSPSCRASGRTRRSRCAPSSRPRPREAAAGQRAPRDHADALVGAERQHLPLLLAVEQVVVVLHRRRSGSSRCARRRAAPWRTATPTSTTPRCSAPCRLDDVVQRLHRLLDRRAVVPAVDLVEVDVVGAEAAQAVVDLASGSPCVRARRRWVRRASGRGPSSPARSRRAGRSRRARAR